MNICFLSREYPPDTSLGGIATQVYELACALAKSGHQIHIVSQAVEKPGLYMDDGVCVHRIRNPTFNLRRGMILDSFSFSLLAWRALKSVIRKYDIDVVESPEHRGMAFFYSYFHQRPLVIRFHTPVSLTSELNRAKGLGINLVCGMESVAIAKSDKLVSISNSLAKIVARTFGLDLSSIRVIHNGIDVTKFDHMCAHSNEVEFKSSLKNSFRILFVGRLERRKGVETLLDSIPTILEHEKDISIIFAGEDTPITPGRESCRNYLLSRAKKKGLDDKIFFTGKVSEAQKIALYKACDVVCIPSLYEAFSYVCLEAMVFAKPIVAGRAGGISEILENRKSGILVPPNNPRELGLALALLLSDKKLRVKLSKVGRKVVEEKFTSERMARETIALYEDTLLH